MRVLILLAGLTLLSSARSLAQEREPPPPPDPADTVRVEPFRIQPPVSPLGALWRSLLLPGWGQSILGRRVTGAAFVFWEGVTLTMTLKAIHQRQYMERTGSANVPSKKQEIQDWAVLLGFNHLMAAAEAYVSSQLWDFPAELELRRLANGSSALGARLSFR